ncbi:hypothetical protein DXG01_011611, partial [Tephrocybe rancida]
WDSEREVSDEEEEDFTSESEPDVEEEMERGELHRPPADANFGTENDVRSGSERASMEVRSDEGSLDAPIRREIDSIDGTARGEADARHDAMIIAQAGQVQELLNEQIRPPDSAAAETANWPHPDITPAVIQDADEPLKNVRPRRKRKA